MLRRPMTRLRLCALLAPLVLLTGTTPAEAAPPAPAPAPAPEPEPDDVPRSLGALALDTGRRPPPVVDPDAFRLVLEGELQLRLQGQRTFPMLATPSAMAAQPGLRENSHGQHVYGAHWLRVTPRFLVRDTVELVGQMDVLTGMNLGETTRDVGVDLTPRSDYDGFSNVQPRWLYIQIRLPFGLLRMGQQPNHWGSGLVYNDGDHPVLFGDYRYGDISERVSLTVRPTRDLVVSLAGDLVYRDEWARLSRGEQAFQGIGTVAWERGFHRLGILGTLRHQRNDERPVSALFGYTDTTDLTVIDVHGRTAAKVPGEDAFVFVEAEAATNLGSTSFFRTVDRGAESRTSIRSYGGAGTIGFVHRAWDASARTSQGSARTRDDALLEGPHRTKGVPYGCLVVQMEVGHASGDADPNDGTQRRFTFDPNHRVGLLLFDEVLRWQTARSAVALVDPLATNATRPPPGAELQASNGGVFGAQYVNPTFVVRPMRRLDLKGGAVIAQSTADVVDPYRASALGIYQNHRGGNAKRRDLGVELDGGFELRVPLDYGLTLQLGAQAGVLFPGGALANGAGERLPPQWLAVARLGLQF